MKNKYCQFFPYLYDQKHDNSFGKLMWYNNLIVNVVFVGEMYFLKQKSISFLVYSTRYYTEQRSIKYSKFNNYSISRCFIIFLNTSVDVSSLSCKISYSKQWTKKTFSQHYPRSVWYEQKLYLHFFLSSIGL